MTLGSAVRERLSAATALALLGLAAASIAVRALIGDWIQGPQVFLDELGYQRMAESFAQTGHFSLFGKSGLAYSPLYPVVISPIYAMTTSVQTAYDWAKVENAVLISVAVFPIYGIARFVLPRGRALGAAALSLIAPLMLYSAFEMSESLAYPLFLVALWAMLRTVHKPSALNDAVLLLSIGVACAARLQQVALIPAALTAVLLVALLRPEHASRGRAVLRGISQHRLLFGFVACVCVGVLVRRAVNGGALPLAGRYSNIGTTKADPLRVIELAVQHLAELDFAVGVIPFAAALLAGYALIRSDFPRKALMFASVAVASTAWLVFEVAFDAAAFDATTAHPRPSVGLVDLPRIHERYLIYLMPLFFVVLFGALPLIRSRLQKRLHLAIAVVAVVLPLLIPFGSVVNSTSPIDSFALQAFGRVKSGQIVPIDHPSLAIFFLSALLAFGYFHAATRPAPFFAIAATGIALFAMCAFELGREVGRTPTAQTGVPANPAWVDRVVGRGGHVSLVGGARVRRIALEETAYWNLSIRRVYYTCKQAFGTDFGEDRLVAAGADGTLTAPAGAIHARYAVAPAAFGIPGRVLATDRVGKLVLVAAPGGLLRVPDDKRSALECPLR